MENKSTKFVDLFFFLSIKRGHGCLEFDYFLGVGTVLFVKKREGKGSEKR